MARSDLLKRLFLAFADGDEAAFAQAAKADREQGRYEPSWPMVLALAGALGVALEDFRARPSAPGTGRWRPRKERPDTDTQEAAGPAGKDVPRADRKPVQHKLREKRTLKPRGGWADGMPGVPPHGSGGPPHP